MFRDIWNWYKELSLIMQILVVGGVFTLAPCVFGTIISGIYIVLGMLLNFVTREK